MHPIRAVLFDFDGLTLDTESPEYDSLAELYAAHGQVLLPERWVQGLGTVGGYDAFAELAALVGHDLDRAALRERHHARFRELIADQPLRPGITALLAHLQAQGIARAVASSSNRSWVEGWLVHYSIRPHFSVVRTSDDVARVKPAPDLFLAAAEALGVPPAECLVLEDSPNGMRAALAAGMRCVAVPLPMVPEPLPPHTLRLRTLADLPPAEIIARAELAATIA